MSRALEVCVAGAGLLGPGFEGWRASHAVLCGRAPWRPGPMPRPQPAMLPSAERRRCPERVRLALTVAQEALEGSGLAGAEVATVFASSDEDGQLAHATCQALAEPEPSASPTRFQNSVHNAVAGYWSIATGSRRPSASISAYDWTFAAALLDAATQASAEDGPVLAVICDLPFPPPLLALRPMDAGLAVALLVCPRGHPRAIARLEIALGDAGPPHQIADVVPGPLQRTPAARALPLLAAIASGHGGVVGIDYLNGAALWVNVR